MRNINIFKLTGYIVVMLGLFFPVSASAWTVALLTGSGGLGDESFNDMTWMGLGMAREECHFNLIYREWGPHISMNLLFQEVLDKGADLVVFNGDQFIPIIKEFAPKYPNILFIANDFYGGEYANLKSIIYSQHEGAFLAGALASLFSHSGQVGFIGAMNIPVVQSFATGFIEGVKYISPDTKVTVEYISSRTDYSGFNNPQKAFQLATSQYAAGVDVIFAVAGVSGNGVIKAATASEKFVIGVDADQDHMAKGRVLTSMMKRLDTALYQETTHAFQGLFSPGITRYGLANGGISLSPMKYTQAIIGERNLKILQDIKIEIINGKIAVPNILENKR